MLYRASLRKLGREGTDLPFKIYVPLHLWIKSFFQIDKMQN